MSILSIDVNRLKYKILVIPPAARAGEFLKVYIQGRGYSLYKLTVDET